jgi:hypothetical protein
MAPGVLVTRIEQPGRLPDPVAETSDLLTGSGRSRADALRSAPVLGLERQPYATADRLFTI